MENTFKCNKCGACCSHLEVFGDLYKDLDNGKGICIFYDYKKHLCLCYKSRPLKCRIIDSYNAFFKDKYSFEEFLKLTYQGCKILQSLPHKTFFN